MNAYEKRKEARKLTRQAHYKKCALAKRLSTADAEKYYEEAFVALNNQKPLVIPNVSTDALMQAGRMMYARLHEIELGEFNET